MATPKRGAKKAAEPKKKPVTPPKADPPKKLPAALAKRANALALRKKADLSARAREEIAFIREKQVEIVGNFYDIGAALNRLSEPGVAEALGYSGIGDLVEAEISMSAARARDLMGIARLVRREDALRWGQEKSAALVELAQATGAADSPATLVKQRTLEIGKGRVINLEEATATAIQMAAKEARAARSTGEKPRRGVTASTAERALAERLQRALHRLGDGRARVVAVARAGAGADLRIDRLPAAALATLAKAVAATQKHR